MGGFLNKLFYFKSSASFSVMYNRCLVLLLLNCWGLKTLLKSNSTMIVVRMLFVLHMQMSNQQFELVDLIPTVTYNY